MSTVTPSTINSSTTLETRDERALRELRGRLQSTRRILIGQRIGVCIAAAMTAAAICLAASASADFFFELPTAWRAVWMISVAAVLAIALAIGWKQWIASYTLSNTAVDAERRLSQFGQRLRTTLDYEQQVPPPAAASPSLLNSLHDETCKLSGQTEWSEAIDSWPLFKALLTTTAVAATWITALILFPEFRISAARAMLIPSEYTTVTYSPQTETIRHGASVTIKAIVEGRPISSAELRYRTSGSNAEWTTVALVPANTDDSPVDDNTVPTPLHGELAATLFDFTQDTEFEIIAGPRGLPPGFVRVLQPLTLEKSTVSIVPPSYTRRPEEAAESLDIKVLEGSRVELKLDFNRDAAEVKLIRSALSSEPKTDTSGDARNEAATQQESPEISLQLNGTTAIGTLTDLRKTASFKLLAHTADGMSLDPVQFSIRVQRDRKPEVTFIEPSEELVVTPSTEVPIIVEASDDLGLHKVGVMFQVAEGPMQTLFEQNAEGAKLHDRLSTELLLEEHGLTHQDAVTYYAFAEDNYFGQPRRTTTPLRFIDIRPYKLSFQVVDQKGGSCNGCSVTLEELIVRQRQGLTQAFQAGEQPLAKQTASYLSEAEEKLQQAAYEFAVGMTERGISLPSLDQAIKHMETAIESLDAIELLNAIAAEQLALAALVRARENVRKKLNQSSSSSASACRKFDREQRQKLRMPEKKKSDQQQQVAEARKKLEDLAKRERQWSQQAQQCCNNSSSSSSGKPGQPKPVASKESPPQTPQSPQDSNQPSKTGESADEQSPENKPSQQQGDQSEARSPNDVAAAQEKMQAELAEIQQQIEQLNQGGQSAKEQAQQAAESMQQGLAELKLREGDAAAKEGERSAEQLEQLSEHLAAMNARDFGQRLEQAQKRAQQLASKQESLEQKITAQGDSGKTGGLARDQKGLAAQTGMLADWLERLKTDARTESGGIKQKLDQVQSENSAREIADGMNQTAEDLQSERAASASRGAKHARERLQELSQSLSAARGEFAQPQLKELMALEGQLAQLQQQMKRLQGKGEDPSSMGQKWQQMESRLDKLTSGDKRLAEAMRQLREGPQGSRHPPNKSDGKTGDPKTSSEKIEPSGLTTSGKVPPKPDAQLKPIPNRNANADVQVPEGFYSWLELGDYSGVREVSKELQARIQEAILAAALMDADQPVPPAYKELVEKYYRALSDDLR